MSVLVLVAWLSSFLGSKWLAPPASRKAREVWISPLATFVRQNQASTITLLRTGLKSQHVTKAIRIGLLQVQELPRDQRRQVNKSLMASLMSVHRSMATAQLWMKENIEHSTVKVLLVDINHTGSLLERTLDFSENFTNSLGQLLSLAGSKVTSTELARLL